MILVGQYDSPFVRRVAVALHLYGMPFTRDRTSVFSAAMARVNPLVRIPSLILEGGDGAVAAESDTLYDSVAILDHLDETAGADKALMPPAGVERRSVMRLTVLAVGATEKAGAVVYERHLHATECVSHEWVSRCEGQLGGVLEHLDRACAVATPWLFGDRITHADIAAACLVFFVRMRLPEALPEGRFAALEALAARCEVLDAFREARPSEDEVMPDKGSARR